MGREQFVGHYRLLSVEYRSDDGEVMYPMGRRAIGRIMYDAGGNMSVQYMDAQRPLFASGDWLGGTPAEIKAAFEGLRTYFGTYDVDEGKGTVTHHLEAGSFPNWAGRDNVRFFRFFDNCLELRTTPLLMGGKYVTGRLVWERIA